MSEIPDPTDIRYYGGDGTIHSGGEVNVELDKRGRVVAVWFRCQPLAFTQSTAHPGRVREMDDMYAQGAIPGLDAVVVRTKP
jgi:hypothetical protein